MVKDSDSCSSPSVILKPTARSFPARFRVTGRARRILDRVGGSSGIHATALSDYDGVKQLAEAARKSRVSVSGDPVASAAVLLKIVDADEPPLRIFFGEAPLAIAKADYASRLATREQWNELSIEAQG